MHYHMTVGVKKAKEDPSKLEAQDLMPSSCGFCHSALHAQLQDGCLEDEVYRKNYLSWLCV